MKRFACAIIGILVIITLILSGCGSSQSGGNQTTSTSSTSYSGQVIVINYSATTIERSAGEWSGTPPREGYIFLLVNLHIENHGYDLFAVSNFFFSIKAGGKTYTPSSMNGAHNELPGGDLHDNESVTGNLAFEVPEGTTDFEIFYKYASQFNMQWNKQ